MTVVLVRRRTQRGEDRDWRRADTVTLTQRTASCPALLHTRLNTGTARHNLPTNLLSSIYQVSSQTSDWPRVRRHETRECIRLPLPKRLSSSRQYLIITISNFAPFLPTVLVTAPVATAAFLAPILPSGDNGRIQARRCRRYSATHIKTQQ